MNARSRYSRLAIALTLSIAVAGHAATSLVVVGSGDAAPAGIGGQDPRFAPAFAEIDKWIGQKAFPGAVVAIGRHDRLLAIKAFGRIESSDGAPPMPVDALFDLASLTKVIGTTTAAEILYDRGKLDLDAPVARYLPAFGGTAGHDAITVRHLLTHSSGLKPSGLLWKQAGDRAGILRLIDTMEVGDPPGTAYKYQDINMILMGEIVEKISGEPLDRFLAREVFKPLGMKDTGFKPSPTLMSRIAPTELDTTFRKMLVRGVVHDENSFVMGGVAGHAGLFSTARDLSALAQLYLNDGTWRGKRLLSRKTIALFSQPQNLPPGSSRALGWDMPSPGGFAGPLASPGALIHTGFTGTSIYIDPARDVFIVLLTNRVNPTRDNQLITQARPAIHTAVLDILDRLDRPK